MRRSAESGFLLCGEALCQSPRPASRHTALHAQVEPVKSPFGPEGPCRNGGGGSNKNLRERERVSRRTALCGFAGDKPKNKCTARLLCSSAFIQKANNAFSERNNKKWSRTK